MSNEIDKANNSASDSTPGPNSEDKKEYSAANNSCITIAEVEPGLSNIEPENEEEEGLEYDYISDISDTPSLKEEKAKEKARRDKLDYAQAFQEKIQFDGTYHPEVDENDLVQVTNGHTVVPQDWFKGHKTHFTIHSGGRKKKELCHNCGWTTHHQVSPEGYSSRLKIRHLRADGGLWEAGPKWFIRDEINNDWNGAANDHLAQEFIRKNVPEVPLVEMHRFGDKEDKYALTVMSRAKGIELAEIEKQLTPKQKDILAEDLASYMKKWRKFTAPRVQTADGKPLRDFIFRCNHGPCQDVPFDTTEWLEKLAPAWRKALFNLKYAPADPQPTGRFPKSWIKEVDEKVAKIKTVLLNEGRLSKEEFVFTHGDLNVGNVFVFEETPGVFKISGIIDWEFAGYCPWWVECFYNITGLFGPERMGLLLPGEDIEAYSTIVDEIYKVWWEIIEFGEELFKHSPSDKNHWYGRPFCECEPFCSWFRSDDAFGLKASREITYSVTENYPSQWIEFDKMWNSLVESEKDQNSSQANSPTK